MSTPFSIKVSPLPSFLFRKEDDSSKNKLTTDIWDEDFQPKRIEECKNFILWQVAKVIAKVALYLILSVGALIATALFAPAIYTLLTTCVVMLSLEPYYKKIIETDLDSIKNKQADLAAYRGLQNCSIENDKILHRIKILQELEKNYKEHAERLIRVENNLKKDDTATLHEPILIKF